MPSFGTMVNQQLMLLLLMVVGVVAQKARLMGEEARGFVGDLLVKVMMPAAILSSFMTEHFTSALMEAFLVALAVGSAVQLGCFFAAKLIYKKAKPEERPVLQYALVSPNSAYVGIPVLEGFYGAEGLLYLAAFQVPVSVCMWGLGMLFFQEKGTKVNLRKILLHPAMVSIYIGVVLLFTGLRPPGFIQQAIHSLGGATTPVAMLLIGAILAEVDPKTVVTRGTLAFSALRLAVIPLCTLVILKLLGAAPVLAGSLVVATGLPAGVATAVVAASFRKNPAYASKLIFVSTVLSMVTLPLLATLVAAVF